MGPRPKNLVALESVLGILPMPEHAVRHPERERGRIGEPRLELAGQGVLRADERTSQAIGKLGHPVSLARRRRSEAGSDDLESAREA